MISFNHPSNTSGCVVSLPLQMYKRRHKQVMLLAQGNIIGKRVCQQGKDDEKEYKRADNMAIGVSEYQD